MMTGTLKTTSSHYLDDDGNAARHWSAQSEKFATGDVLATALASGWTYEGVVFREDFWHTGGRRVPVYHIRLRRGSEHQRMTVVHNPYIQRLLKLAGVQVVLMNQRKDEVVIRA